MEQNIVYYHKELQKYIHKVEKDENDKDALETVKAIFLKIFDIVKMIMISRQERYYGIFLMNLELKIDFTSYFDAGISIDYFPFRITVNPLLIGLRSLPEMIYIFCHEIEHIVLNHPSDSIRYNPRKDPLLSYKLNIAMDAGINDRLTEDAEKNEFNIIAEPEDAVTSKYLSECFKIHIKALQAFDYYFERIPDLEKEEDASSRIVFADKAGKTEIITEDKRKNAVYIHCWTTSDDPDECTSIIKRFVSGVCSGMPDSLRGTLPAYQKQTLDRLFESPSISWNQLLKRYIGTVQDGHRKTQLRLNRRQPERYDLARYINNRIIKLVVAIDTSYSMSNEALSRIMVEIFDIAGSRKCEITVIECDTEIKHIYKPRTVKDISYDIHGRGGTSFVPVIEYVNSDRYFRDAVLIYFTDGMGEDTIPRPLTRRMMWVLQDKECMLSVREPYGEVLFMEE